MHKIQRAGGGGRAGYANKLADPASPHARTGGCPCMLDREEEEEEEEEAEEAAVRGFASRSCKPICRDDHSLTCERRRKRRRLSTDKQAKFSDPANSPARTGGGCLRM